MALAKFKANYFYALLQKKTSANTMLFRTNRGQVYKYHTHTQNHTSYDIIRKGTRTNTLMPIDRLESLFAKFPTVYHTPVTAKVSASSSIIPNVYVLLKGFNFQYCTRYTSTQAVSVCVEYPSSSFKFVFASETIFLPWFSLFFLSI